MKRGEFSTTFIGNAVLTVIMILLFATLWVIFSSSEDSFREKNRCPEIATHYAVNAVSKGEILTDINCPTEFVTDETINEERAKQVIAKEMVTCWDMWGKGEYQLFNDQEGVYCHVCSLVDLPNVDQVSNMVYYLDETKHPSGVSLLKYFEPERSGIYEY
jgi:hypothetical protein